MHGRHFKTVEEYKKWLADEKRKKAHRVDKTLAEMEAKDEEVKTATQGDTHTRAR